MTYGFAWDQLFGMNTHLVFERALERTEPQLMLCQRRRLLGWVFRDPRKHVAPQVRFYPAPAFRLFQLIRPGAPHEDTR